MVDEIKADFEVEFLADFLDGQNIRHHLINLCLTKDALILKFQTKSDQVSWLYEDIEALPRPVKKDGVLFLNKKYPDAQLFVQDYKQARLIIKHTSFRCKKFYFGSKIAITSLALFLCIIFLGALLSFLILKYTPPQMESKIGRLALSELLEKREVCENEESDKALGKIVNQLSLENKDEQSYKVIVMKYNYGNAISLPGGFIVISSGLIDNLELKEELYFVLAHEIAHIKNRDSLSTVAKTLIIEHLIFVTTLRDANYASLSLFNLNNGREKELRADQVATRTLNQMGVDVSLSVKFLERINRRTSALEKKLFSTHLTSGYRINNIKKSPKSSKKKDLISDEEWLAIRAVTKFCVANKLLDSPIE